MDSDLHRQHHHHHHHHYNHHQQQQQQQQQQQVMNSGLTRYRSAPSSYFSDLINSGLFGDDGGDPFFNTRVSNAETDQIFTRFTSSSSAAVAAAAGGGGRESTAHQIMNQIGGFEQQLMDSIKQEQEGIYAESQQQQHHHQQHHHHQQQQMMYQNQNHNQFQSHSQSNQNNHHVSTCSSTIDNSLTTMNVPTNLPRQNSSPAGFFAHLDLDNGYPLMRSMDDFRGSRGNVTNSMVTSTKRMKNEMGFSSGSQLSSGVLPRIPENEAKVMEMKSTRNDGGFGSDSWDDSDIFSDSFLKEFGESDQNKLSSLNSSHNQHNDVGRIRAPTTLVHHLSLPASTAELDKLMQFQDSVPIKSRAKRGCATHPRSIAERVNILAYLAGHMGWLMYQNGFVSK